MATAGPSKSDKIKDKANPAGATVNEDERKKGAENTERSRNRNKRQTDLKHILLSPETYIGSLKPAKELLWVYEEEAGMQRREITYVPGLVKMFDQILINAAHNKDRNPKMNTIKVDIDLISSVISVFNNGTSLCVQHLGERKVYLPYVGVGYVLDKSDYEDDKKSASGHVNYGPKLMVLSNVFSTMFEIETGSKSEKKKFKQSWIDNMTQAGIARASLHKGADFTRITFSPDLARFKMDSLDKDTVALLYRRAVDVAATTRGVKVYLNGNRLPMNDFKDYVELCLEGKKDGDGNELECVYEAVSERWEIAVAPSDNGFQQVSFANSIATTKGGSHVDYVTDIILKHLNDFLEKSGTPVDMAEIKNHLWIFVNCKVDNPTFESKIQDIMTLKVELFGSTCEPSDKFFKKLSKSSAKFKPKAALEKSKVPTRRCPDRAAKVNQGNYFVAAKTTRSTAGRKVLKRTAVKRAASATPANEESKRKRTGKKTLAIQVKGTAPVPKTTKAAQKRAVQSTTSNSRNVGTVSQGNVTPAAAVAVKPMIVRVSNIPANTTQAHIGSLLSPHGELQWIAIMALKKDPTVKEALVQFKKEENAKTAASILNGYLVGDRKWAITQADQGSWGDFIIPEHMKPNPPEVPVVVPNVGASAE